MAKATLTISSKNYSSWSLRGWLLTRFSGLEFDEIITAPDDASARAEMLLLSSSILVPCLRHEGATVWDTLAIAEYLNEIRPDAGLLPADRISRAHCRSICGEIHSGFTTLRASLPVNLKGHFPGFKIWSRAQADIDRVANHAAQSGAQAILTTAKDAVKLKSFSFALPCYVVEIAIQIEDEERFLECINRAVDAHRA